MIFVSVDTPAIKHNILMRFAPGGRISFLKFLPIFVPLLKSGKTANFLLKQYLKNQGGLPQNFLSPKKQAEFYRFLSILLIYSYLNKFDVIFYHHLNAFSPENRKNYHRLNALSPENRKFYHQLNTFSRESRINYHRQNVFSP
jgi:hypothetical protein